MLIIEFYDEVYLFGSINSQLSNILDDHNLVMMYVVDSHLDEVGCQKQVVDFRIVLRDLPELPVMASKYSGYCYRLVCILFPVIEYA